MNKNLFLSLPLIFFLGLSACNKNDSKDANVATTKAKKAHLETPITKHQEIKLNCWDKRVFSLVRPHLKNREDFEVTLAQKTGSDRRTYQDYGDYQKVITVKDFKYKNAFSTFEYEGELPSREKYLNETLTKLDFFESFYEINECKIEDLGNNQELHTCNYSVRGHSNDRFRFDFLRQIESFKMVREYIYERQKGQLIELSYKEDGKEVRHKYSAPAHLIRSNIEYTGNHFEFFSYLTEGYDLFTDSPKISIHKIRMDESYCKGEIVMGNPPLI